jgi:hypothetical protein
MKLANDLAFGRSAPPAAFIRVGVDDGAADIENFQPYGVPVSGAAH